MIEGEKKKMIIISALSVVLISVLALFVVLPLLRGVDRELTKLMELRKESSFLGKNVQVSSRIEDRYEKIKSDLDRMDNIFVDSQSPVDLIEFWEKTAEGYNLSISISPFSLRKNKNDLWDSIGFQLSLAGSFSGFSKFLEKLETSYYLIDIQSLTINRVGENKDNEKSKGEEEKILLPNDVKANLIVKVFVK